MKVGAAIAEIMKREGVEILAAYPVNHLIEYAAATDIRPIIVRQERIGLHMADAISRITPGAQARRVLHAAWAGHRERLWRHRPGLQRVDPDLGRARRAIRAAPPMSAPTTTPRARCAAVTKSAEPITSPAEVVNIMRRAFSHLRNGRGGPALVEVPHDLWHEEMPEPLNYTPVVATRMRARPGWRAEARRAARQGQAAGDLRGPGRALGARLAAAARARRAARQRRS